MRSVVALVVAMLAAAVAAIPVRAAEPGAQPTVLTIVVVGDTGLNEDMQRVVPAGGYKWGTLFPWGDAIAGMRGELDGDLTVANLETVVSDRNELRAEPKQFRFRMHPEGVRQLVRAGINVFTTANNHSMDFGAEGARETLRHLDALRADGLLAHAGVGASYAAAAQPTIAEVKGVRVAIGAIGIVTQGLGHHRAGDNRPGQLAHHSHEDFQLITQRLAAAAAGFRVLAVHHGQEFDILTSPDQIRRLRDQAVRGAGVDLVIGHHQHVVAGVEMVDGRLIFYGLGNFVHFGTMDMGRMNACRDYGLVGRVHLKIEAGRAAIRAIEAIPIKGTHLRPVRFEPTQARQRIQILNALSARLDNAASGARGVRFKPTEDGSGLYCSPGAEQDGGRIGALCARAASEAAVADPGRTATAACGEALARGGNPLRASRGASASKRQFVADTGPESGSDWQRRILGP